MKDKHIMHSKVKNPGILFELLVRQITVDTLGGKEASPAVSVMRKYFRPTTELGKELQLYRSFFEVNNLTEVKASKFIDLVVQQRNKLDERKLATEKYELIKEIKNHYDLKEFLSVKIPSYKIYASVYKTFLSESNSFDISSINDIAESRFTLMEHLVTDKKNRVAKAENAILEIFKTQSEDLRLLTYKVMLDKFNDKYSNLNGKQKRLLREYVNSVSNSESFVQYIHTEINPLRDEITSLAAKEGDKVLQIKLNEVASQLDNIKNKKKIKDNELTAMMIAYQLAEELKTQ